MLEMHLSAVLKLVSRRLLCTAHHMLCVSQTVFVACTLAHGPLHHHLPLLAISVKPKKKSGSKKKKGSRK
jgi:hypothetical protein